jgi:UDP-N-acetylbacillosamine N-acetyltransferase
MSYLGLIILGFGGHARAVGAVALACGVKKLVFVEVSAREGENFFGHPVQAMWPDRLPTDWASMPASGTSPAREAQASAITARGWRLARLIGSSATISQGVLLIRGLSSITNAISAHLPTYR